jgi:hypothetical protein
MHSLENSPKADNKKSRLRSPYRNSFVDRSLMTKNSKSSNKNFYSHLNTINSINNTSRFQNSFSFLSNINKNNLSLSLNMSRKKIPKIKISNRKKIDEDFQMSNNLHTYNNYNNTTSQASLDTSSNLNTLISIDRYNTVKTETMTRYRIEHIKNEDKDEDKLNGNLFGNQSIVESSKNSMEQKIHETSLIQIHIKDKNFGNPQESKDVISTNKFIFENLNGSLIDIQKIFYDKTLKDIEHFNKCNLKMQNIRVSPLVPKTVVEKPPKQKETSIISEDANEDMEKEGEGGEEGEKGGEEDDYLEKKKEKEKLKQIKLKDKREKEDAKLKNRFSKSSDYELYAEYKYSNKIFPEGRENFSFGYNSVDVVLFGGLLMNKNNNNLWTFNPCK